MARPGNLGSIFTFRFLSAVISGHRASVRQRRHFHYEWFQPTLKYPFSRTSPPHTHCLSDRCLSVHPSVRPDTVAEWPFRFHPRTGMSPGPSTPELSSLLSYPVKHSGLTCLVSLFFRYFKNYFGADVREIFTK